MPRAAPAFVVLLLLAPLPARAAAPEARAAAFLSSAQTSSGAFGSADAPADSVAETIAALAAVDGRSPSIARALGYLRVHGPARARVRPAYAARLVMGIAAAGEDPRRFGGFDYVAELHGALQPSGKLDDGVYGHALAIVGLIAAREPVPDQAITYLRGQQCPGGGFAHAEGCLGRPDVDTTAMALMALVGARVDREDLAVSRARSFLLAARNGEGAWGYAEDQATNANSTGLALSAIEILGERGGRAAAVRALLRLQHPGGGFRYLRGDREPSLYATVQAMPGLVARPWPVRARSVRLEQSAGRERIGLRALPAPNDGGSATALAARATAEPLRASSAEAAARAAGARAPAPAPTGAPTPLAAVAAMTFAAAALARVTVWRRAR